MTGSLIDLSVKAKIVSRIRSNTEL